jgi:multisubunit Na+/H+ antiporter MnhC subunit
MELALSLMVLAAIALVIGAILLWRKGGARKQIGLMLLLALIMAVNVAIWTLPDGSGEAPLGQELR